MTTGEALNQVPPTGNGNRQPQAPRPWTHNLGRVVVV